MLDSARSRSSGYSFATWPAAPPVFEAIAPPSRLWIPAGTSGWHDSTALATTEQVAMGAPVLQQVESAALALAPAAGRATGIRRATLTNARDVAAVEFDVFSEPDPVWIASDDQTAPPRLQRAEPATLIDWIERFRAAGIWADRNTSPDLIAQLYQALRRPVDTVICCGIDADPSACLNSALAAWFAVDLAAGVSLLARITRAGRAIVVLDPRLPAAWSNALRRCAGGMLEIAPLMPDYPLADPVLMLYTLLHRRLRPGRLPVEQGVIQLDAAAAIAVGRYALSGAPMLSVPVVVRDHVLRQSFFLFAPIGMRAGEVLEQASVAPDCCELRGGDVLRNLTLPLEALIGGGELVLHASAPEPRSIPEPCVRCGWCVEACPTRVQPAGVLEAAHHADLKLALSYGLDACIECGICTYVCPSRLPLLASIQKMRIAREAAKRTT